jgi:hypothetical protein
MPTIEGIRRRLDKLCVGNEQVDAMAVGETMRYQAAHGEYLEWASSKVRELAERMQVFSAAIMNCV